MKYIKRQRVLSLLLICIIFSTISALAGSTGKLRGTVTDSQNGEPLIGANIFIDGTSYGGSTDINGQYIILNIDPGVYKVRATYIGYTSQVISNVQVNLDLTTDLNIKLSSSSIQMQTVEIVKEMPLVNKSSTNTVSIVTADNLKYIPVRTLNAVFALSSGVVAQKDANGNMDYYVRGGRAEETSFYVDGVLVNNPMNGRMNLNIINNAIEEVESQIGGMTAEYGNAMSGSVSTSTKTGGSKYNISGEGISDELLGGKTSKNFLGAYSYGLNEYVLTASGPVIPNQNKLRFFVSGQRQFNQSNPSFLDGMNFPVPIDSNAITGVDWVVVNRNAATNSYKTLADGTTGNRTYLANLLNTQINGGRGAGLANASWSGMGNLLLDLGSFNIKAGGSYNSYTNNNPFSGTNAAYGNVQDYGWGLGKVNTASGLARGVQTKGTDASAYTRFSYAASQKTIVTLNLAYYRSFQEQGDPEWMGNVEAYGNPNLNPSLVGPSLNAPLFNVYSFTSHWPNFIPLQYFKNIRSNIGGRLDFVSQVSPTWELKLGADLTDYTIRTYQVDARSIYLNRLNATDPTHGDWYVYSQANVGAYGFDIYGNEFNGGRFIDRTGRDTVDLSKDGPNRPIFAGAYIQNKFEFDDLIMNIGFRFDYLYPAANQYKDLANVSTLAEDGIYMVADTSLKPAQVYTQLSPRFGFSFPVADRTVFHATYGKFMQYGQLSDLYDPRETAGRFFQGGYARQFPNPNLAPERTTSYEVGFRQQVGEIASFDATFFYKDIKDLHVIRVIFPEEGSVMKAPWYATVNGDFGTSKGITLVFNLRRTNRVSLTGNYTLSSSVATGSASGTHFDIAWQDNSYNGQPYFPVIPAPTDFDRTHTGNINLDYRFEKDDGPTIFGTKPLQRVGLNLLFTFSSGIRYTLSDPSTINGSQNFSGVNAPLAGEGMNSSTGPWIYQLDLKLDKTFSLFDLGEINVYLWIENVLNKKNVLAVYSGTGLPNNDGWFTTPKGQTWAADNGPGAVALYNYLQNDPANYGTPRTIRLGVQFNL